MVKLMPYSICRGLPADPAHEQEFIGAPPTLKLALDEALTVAKRRWNVTLGEEIRPQSPDYFLMKGAEIVVKLYEQ